MEEYKHYWTNYLNFKKRSTILDLCIPILINFVILIPLVYLFFTESYLIIKILLALFIAVNVLPTVSLLVRRVHDANYSIKLFFFLLIPIVGLIILIAFLLRPSEYLDNRYFDE